MSKDPLDKIKNISEALMRMETQKEYIFSNLTALKNELQSEPDNPIDTANRQKLLRADYILAIYPNDGGYELIKSRKGLTGLFEPILNCTRFMDDFTIALRQTPTVATNLLWNLLKTYRDYIDGYVEQNFTFIRKDEKDDQY